MVDLIIVKDPHYRFGFNKPIGRLSDFHEEIEAKNNFIINYAIENEITNVVFTGDVNDVKSLSKYEFKPLKATEDTFDNFKSNLIDIHSISGNHDLPFSNVDYKDKSVYFSHLVKHGYINDLDTKENGVTFGEDLTLHGIDFTPSIEELSEKIAVVNEKARNDSKYTALVLHEHCIPDESQKEIYLDTFYTYSNLSALAPDVDIFILGHLHKGFPNSKNKKGQYFINPWSLTRLARKYYAVGKEHTPEFVHLQVDKETGITVKKVAIPHKPFDKAFNLEEFSKGVRDIKDIDDFIGNLNKVKEGESDDTINVDDPKVKAKINHYLSLVED